MRFFLASEWNFWGKLGIKEDNLDWRWGLLSAPGDRKKRPCTHFWKSYIYSGAGTISFVKYFNMHLIFLCEKYISNSMDPVILLPAYPASFTHNFVSGMQSLYFNESQDAKVMQTCH